MRHKRSRQDETPVIGDGDGGTIEADPDAASCLHGVEIGLVHHPGVRLDIGPTRVGRIEIDDMRGALRGDLSDLDVPAAVEKKDLAVPCRIPPAGHDGHQIAHVFDREGRPGGEGRFVRNVDPQRPLDVLHIPGDLLLGPTLDHGGQGLDLSGRQFTAPRRHEGFKDPGRDHRSDRGLTQGRVSLLRQGRTDVAAAIPAVANPAMLREDRLRIRDFRGTRDGPRQDRDKRNRKLKNTRLDPLPVFHLRHLPWKISSIRWNMSSWVTSPFMTAMTSVLLLKPDQYIPSKKRPKSRFLQFLGSSIV